MMQKRWREGTQRRDFGTPSTAHLFADHRPSTSREVYELRKVTRRTLTLRTSPSSLHRWPIVPVKLDNRIPTRVWPARVRCHMVLDILPEAGEALRQEAVLVAEIGMELLRREVWSAIEHNDEFQQRRHLVVRAFKSVPDPAFPPGSSVCLPTCSHLDFDSHPGISQSRRDHHGGRSHIRRSTSAGLASIEGSLLPLGERT